MEGAASLDFNQVIQILEGCHTIDQQTKDRLGKLKYQANKWQEELLFKWRNLEFPTYSLAEIRSLNDSRSKLVQKLNKTRNDVRSYLINIGNGHIAMNLEDIEDNSKRGKDSIIRQGRKTLGWHPLSNRWIQILSDLSTISISDFASCITSCQYTGALNIPQTLDKLLDEGAEFGLSEDLYKSLFLDFIRVYKAESFQTAKSFSRNANEILQFIISLVNTSSEISKVRSAIKEICRNETDELIDVILKLKSLTTSLLFLVNPKSNRTSVEKRSNSSAIDAIFDLINPTVLGHLRAFKQRISETSTELDLNALITETVRLEGLYGRPNRPMKLSEKSQHADSLESYYSNFHRDKNDKFQKRDRHFSKERKDTSQKSRDGSKNNYHSPKSRDYNSSRERYPSKERSVEMKGEHKSRETHRRDRHSQGRSTSRDRNPSKSPFRRSKSKDGSRQTDGQNGCLKCGGNHLARSCRRYPFFTDERCQNCNLLHPTTFCRFVKSRYITPDREKSPKNFNLFKNDKSLN